MSPKTNPAVKDDLAQSDKPLASQDSSPVANVDLSQEIRLMFAEMRTKFAKMDAKMEIKFAEMKAEMEIKFAKLETEMRTKFAKVETEFAVVKREIKAIDTKLDGQIKEFNNLRQRVDAKELTQGRLIVSIILVILGSATTIIAQRILPGLGQ
jgi:phage host-nuclease inhibitor protein Gam